MLAVFGLLLAGNLKAAALIEREPAMDNLVEAVKLDKWLERKESGIPGTDARLSA